MHYTEFNIVFNLSFEMRLVYFLPIICDKGKDFKDFTIHKLNNSVLYIETPSQRFEINLKLLDRGERRLFIWRI